MQYGHWVVSATATAINSLYLTGIAPSATANLSNAQKAFITSGASSFIFLILVRFSLLYIRMDFSVELLVQDFVATTSMYSAATSVVPGVLAMLCRVCSSTRSR